MNRRQPRPGIERLETRTLQSQAAPGLIGHPAGPGATAVVGTISSHLPVSIKTNHVVYKPGEMVRMIFIEKNNTGHNVRVAIGPSIDGFSVTHAGNTVWRSNSGFVAQFIEVKRLAPGASITLTATWTASSVPGKYVGHNQMAAGDSAAFKIARD
jgi:Intracellular proteinase inhibitor